MRNEKHDGPTGTDSDHLLQGIAASRGQVTGPCRVIKNPEELHRLQPGDILVAQSTNPSWTPVFSIIGGLIVEHGSALSHAAIIAREYGIPAVMGVAGATGLLADGIQVTVDGSKGLISTHSKISVLGIE
jgi:phosphohistidine swiveling domain-containing protein